MRLDHKLFLQRNARGNRCVSGWEKLPFAEYSVVRRSLNRALPQRPPKKIVWDDFHLCASALRWTGRVRLVLRSSHRERRRKTPGSKFAGGHRIRVTPVPIPNTEVKPDTADGTMWETAWESRSLPAVIQKQRPDVKTSGLLLLMADG